MLCSVALVVADGSNSWWLGFQPSGVKSFGGTGNRNTRCSSGTGLPSMGIDITETRRGPC